MSDWHETVTWLHMCGKWQCVHQVKRAMRNLFKLVDIILVSVAQYFVELPLNVNCHFYMDHINVQVSLPCLLTMYHYVLSISQCGNHYLVIE